MDRSGRLRRVPVLRVPVRMDVRTGVALQAGAVLTPQLVEEGWMDGPRIADQAMEVVDRRGHRLITRRIHAIGRVDRNVGRVDGEDNVVGDGHDRVRNVAGNDVELDGT